MTQHYFTISAALLLGSVALLAGCENPVTVPDRDTVAPTARISAAFGGNNICVDTRPEFASTCANESPDVAEIAGAIPSDRLNIIASGFDAGGVSSVFVCAVNGSFENIAANVRVASPTSPLFDECLFRTGLRSAATDALHISARFRRTDPTQDSLLQVDTTDFGGRASSAVLQLVPR